MKRSIILPNLVAALSLMLSGCANFRPVVDEVRHFVLTPAKLEKAAADRLGAAVGLGPVLLPGYLIETRLAIHRSANEIYYAENSRWAERLDKNIQRVLGANLGALLGSTNVHLSPWRGGAVKVELYVTFNRFELDQKGNVNLEAEWVLTAAQPQTVVRSGIAKASRQGPPEGMKHEEAVAALSAALGDVSRDIGAALTSLK